MLEKRVGWSRATGKLEAPVSKKENENNGSIFVVTVDYEKC